MGNGINAPQADENILTFLPKLEDSEDSHIPLYTQIYDVFSECIHSGVLSPGTVLPGETSLALHFGTSRGTIRRALQFLEEGGFILKRQGKGTVVANMSHKPQCSLQPYEDICKVYCVEEISRTAVNVEYTAAGRWTSNILHIDKGALLMGAKLTYYAGDQLCAVSERLIPIGYLEELHVDTGSRKAIENFLTHQIFRRVSRSEIEISSVISSMDTDGNLPEVPCLFVQEVTYDSQDRPISFHKNYLCGDCYRLEMMHRHRPTDSYTGGQ